MEQARSNLSRIVTFLLASLARIKSMVKLVSALHLQLSSLLCALSNYGRDDNAAFDALSPKYKVVLVASEVDDFVSKLKSAETTPRAVSIGPIYPAEEQDRLAKGIESSGILCKVIRTQPLEKYMKEMDEKTKGMEELEKVGKITRMMFDAANIE